METDWGVGFTVEGTGSIYWLIRRFGVSNFQVQKNPSYRKVMSYDLPTADYFKFHGTEYLRSTTLLIRRITYTGPFKGTTPQIGT